MRIAKVIGTVTLNRQLPSFLGARLKVVVPQSLANLEGEQADRDDFLVAWDDTAAGMNDMVALSEGGEAAQPFRPEMKPVDAYAAAILDQINIDPTHTKRLGQ